MHVLSGLRLGMLALSCAGCTADPRDGARDPSATRTPTLGADEPESVTAMAPESLRIQLDVRQEVRVGQPVPIAIRLKNEGERPLDLYLRGRTIAFDIFITRTDGRMVWQRLKDEIIPAIIQVKVLKPGEVLELEAEWPQRDDRGNPVERGSYVVRGTILTDGPAPLETAPASLRIVSR